MLITPTIAFGLVLSLLAICTFSLIDHLQPVDMSHLKYDVTFFVISLMSTIVMTHIIIKNRAEIKGLIFEKDD